jgi:chaperonin GroES
MITPLHRDIAVKPIPDPDKTKSGLWIPDEAKERTDQGIVAYTGPNVKSIKKGDYVLFSGYTGTVVQLEDEADGVLIVFDERFVTAVLNNPDTEVRGLYFRGLDGEYFEATYEMVMNLIAESFRGTPFARGTGFRNPLDAKPANEDYNRLEEDDDEMITPTPEDVTDKNWDASRNTQQKKSPQMIGNRVLVKPDPEVEKIGSIYVPDNAKEKPAKGTVVAVGPGEYTNQRGLQPCQVKVGDRIIYGKYAGVDVDIDSESFVTLKES